ncbi:MAG: hypothetical protein HY934_04515 [Candidatus Firestonebacteria bacterium]|nr:hypothetical protein [Candidatus Firestonebacteria bacterium]
MLTQDNGICGVNVNSLCIDGNILWVGTDGNNGGLTKVDLSILIKIFKLE